MGKWIWIGAGAVLLVIVAGCKATRAGYESPKYALMTKDGRFEIRDYPAMVVVSTPMAGVERGMDGSFGRLFGYITGGNQRNEKISMTTPVLISSTTNAGQMSFILPKALARAGAPVPVGTNVMLKSLLAGRFAVLRFSGSRSGTQPQKAGRRLEDWIHQQHLSAVSSLQFAYYDPPWTPSFLRRNEVMMRVEDNNKDSGAPNLRH
jgi:hypothetical protein